MLIKARSLHITPLTGASFTELAALPGRSHRSRQIECKAADIQFIRGVNEPSVPEVKMTRSRDGTNGTATFIFDTPSIFEASSELGDITGDS